MFQEELEMNDRTRGKHSKNIATQDRTFDNISGAERHIESNVDGQAFFTMTRNRHKYREILSGERSPDKLLERFAQETTVLRRSDAVGQNFSYNDSLGRLMEGYWMILFDYDKAMPVKVYVSVDGYGILLKKPRSLERRIPYSDFSGVLLAGISSTFQNFENAGGSLQVLGLEPTDCFSVVGNLMSLDFATHSDTAKYDFIHVVGYNISSSTAHMSPLIPLSKKEITYYKIKVKIQAMAKERYLFVKELFLLAIAKTLVSTDASQDKISFIMKILEKSTSPGTKLYRIVTLMKDKNIFKSRFFIQKFEDSTRIMTLTRRMAHTLLNKTPAEFRSLRENSATALQLASFKQLLSKKKGLHFY